MRCFGISSIARLPEYSAEYSAVVGGGRVGKRPGRRIRRHSRRVDKVADVLKTAVDTRHRQKMHRQKKRRRARAAAFTLALVFCLFDLIRRRRLARRPRLPLSPRVSLAHDVSPKNLSLSSLKFGCKTQSIVCTTPSTHTKSTARNRHPLTNSFEPSFARAALAPKPLAREAPAPPLHSASQHTAPRRARAARNTLPTTSPLAAPRPPPLALPSRRTCSSSRSSTA